MASPQELGLGTSCPRCGESHVLCEVTFSTNTPFTTDKGTWIMCSRCLDEFVTGKIERISPTYAGVDPTLWDWIQGHV